MGVVSGRAGIGKGCDSVVAGTAHEVILRRKVHSSFVGVGPVAVIQVDPIRPAVGHARVLDRAVGAGQAKGDALELDPLGENRPYRAEGLTELTKFLKGRFRQD